MLATSLVSAGHLCDLQSLFSEIDNLCRVNCKVMPDVMCKVMCKVVHKAMYEVMGKSEAQSDA